MKRMFINTKIFTTYFDKLISEGKLLQADFDKFENDLLQDPKRGEVIPGMGGLRKARIKSAAGGKSGGFRVDYLDFPEVGITYYVVIYPKNVKDDLSPSEKKVIFKLVEKIKEGVKQHERNV